MRDWNTVPSEYGGRTLPLLQRLRLEWIWRRYGTAGLDRYMWKRTKRVARGLREMAEASMAATTRWAQACQELERTMRAIQDEAAEKNDQQDGDAGMSVVAGCGSGDLGADRV